MDYSWAELVDAYLKPGQVLYATGNTHNTKGQYAHFTDRGDSVENIIGSPGPDQLWGDAGANFLDGGHGADTLISGGGADTMTSADGYDTFQFANGDASPSAPVTLANFAVTSDVIDLRGIDANTSTTADDAFHFVDAFTGHAGEAHLAYKAATGVTTLTLDTNGDGAADYVILIDARVNEHGPWML